MEQMEAWPVARYRVAQRSYMPRMPGREHELVEEGAEVLYAGKPGPHLIPLDEAGQEAWKKAEVDKMRLDPFSTIPLNNAASDEDVMAERVAAAVSKALATVFAGFMQAPQQMAPGTLQPPMQPPPAVPEPPATVPPPPPEATQVPPPPPPPPEATGARSRK